MNGSTQRIARRATCQKYRETSQLEIQHDSKETIKKKCNSRLSTSLRTSLLYSVNVAAVSCSFSAQSERGTGNNKCGLMLKPYVMGSLYSHRRGCSANSVAGDCEFRVVLIKCRSGFGLDLIWANAQLRGITI